MGRSLTRPARAAARGRAQQIVDWPPGAEEGRGMQVGHMLLTHSKGHENYFDTVTTLAKASEELGLDSLWFPDHFMFRNPNRPEQTFDIMECFTSMAAVAAITSRVKLGQYVTGLPYRNPALLAKMLTTLD